MAGFVLGSMLSMYVVFSNFGLASGNGLSPAAIGTIVALILGGVALGQLADKRWQPVAPDDPEPATLGS